MLKKGISKAHQSAVADLRPGVIIHDDESIITANNRARQFFGMGGIVIPASLDLIPVAGYNEIIESVKQATDPVEAGFFSGTISTVVSGVENEYEITVTYIGKGLYHLEITEPAAGRKMLQAEIIRAMQEKEVLLKEVHHRVKNNMQIVLSLLKLQGQIARNDDVRSELKKSYDRIKSMTLVQEQFYGGGQIIDVDMSEYVSWLSKLLYRSYKTDPDLIRFTSDMKGLRLNVDLAVNLGLILNEIISNSLQHAFSDGATGEISVKANFCENGRVEICCIDNGKGMPPGFPTDNSDTMGYIIISLLAKQIDGTLKISGENGVKISISFYQN